MNQPQSWQQMTYPFENIALPYAPAALEPYFDTKTVTAHYDRVFVDYLNQLNAYLDARPELQGLTLTELLNHATENKDETLAHCAGGVYNHCFFFHELRPATGQIVIGITPQATAKITAAFGGWKDFKNAFTKAALGVFGSGYVWLVKNAAGNLAIVTTTDETKPASEPILCLDVWEHAYYLRHLTDRAAYVDAFWSVVDWVKLCSQI